VKLSSAIICVWGLLFSFVQAEPISSAADEQPQHVTVEQLLAAPRKLVGKRVEITGYYRAGFEDSSLLKNARAAKQSWTPDHSIWLDIPDRRSLHLLPHVSAVKALRGRMVRVVGKFRYRQAIPADSRLNRGAVSGYGHMGMWSCAITDITYLRPLK
jgi:hypothetical protein